MNVRSNILSFFSFETLPSCIKLIPVAHNAKEEMALNPISQLWSKVLHLLYTKHVNKHINIDHLRDGGSQFYFVSKPYAPKQFWPPFSVTPLSLSNFLWHPCLRRNPLSLNSLPRL